MFSHSSRNKRNSDTKDEKLQLDRNVRDTRDYVNIITGKDPLHESSIVR